MGLQGLVIRLGNGPVEVGSTDLQPHCLTRLVSADA